MDKKTILIVDDDNIILDSLCEFLSLEGFKTKGVQTYNQAISELQKHQYSLVITDVNLPDKNGFELLETIRSNYSQTVLIVITGFGTIESAVKAIKLGAYDYLTKPIVDDELRLAVQRALQQQNLISENEMLKSQLEQKYTLENIVSRDYKMARIFDLVDTVADTNTTILMTGPSGTGKSMLARAIHYRSSRTNKPFVEVSCGALPETLLESELFGHVRGAFTGAINDKQGKFLAADGGTIFLDEISNASPALQVKLLRVLQDRQLEPVGSNKTYTVDTRILLASNKNLEEEVRQSRFREDLYYRINVVTIDLPPLEERIGDVPLLAKVFLNHYCTKHGRHKETLTQEALEYLKHYSWPGNVRELENVIERAVLLSKTSFIGLQDLPETIRSNHFNKTSRYKKTSLKEALAEPEKQILRQALAAHNFNRQNTAQALQINRTTLYKKMKAYGLDREGPKPN